MLKNSTHKTQNSERPIVKLRISLLSIKVPVTHLRAYLISINLLVFLAALSSFSAARDATIFHNEYLCEGHEEINKHSENTLHQKVAIEVNNYIENILYLTSTLLFLHWLVYGVAVSVRFDGTFEKCSLSTQTVHTLVTIVWELLLAVLLLKLAMTPTQHPMDKLYDTWTSTLVILLVGVIPVQLITVLLPVFCFQDDLNCTEEGKIWHTAAATQIKWTTRKSRVQSLNNTELPVKSPSLGLCSTNMPKSPVPSIYHTEMPDQILKKNKLNRGLLDEGQVDIFSQRKDLSSLEADYMDMLGGSDSGSPPPSYHSNLDLNFL